MELETILIHKNKTPMVENAQMVLEEDYNLPEYKPDILNIIKSRGYVVLEESMPEQEHISLQGKLFFEILYQGEGSEPMMDAIKGSMPFRERLPVDGMESESRYSLKTTAEDIGVVVINSRKISLRGLVSVEVFETGGEQVQLPIVGEYEKAYQIRKEEKTVLKLLEQTKDRLRLKQEVTLPKEKETMEAVLWQNLQLEQVDMRQSAEGIEWSALLNLFALYRTEKKELAWYETSLPVRDTISCEIPGSDGFYQVKLLNTQTSVEAREDLDGELRVLSGECFVEVEVSVWQEETLELLEDAYSMTSELQVHRHKEDMWRIAMKNQAQLPVEYTYTLPQTKEAMYLCNSQWDVKLQEIRVEQGSVVIKGNCYVEVLYLTTEESMPLACAKFTIPFSGEVEAGGMQEGDYVDVDASMFRLQSSLLDSGNLLCRGEVALQLLAFHKEELLVPDAVVEEPLDLELLQNQPGMIGYVVKSGDVLWDIAKQFHTTKEELLEVNQLTQETLHPGQKLLVMKCVGTCTF